MELTQLRCFLAVAGEKNFTRAAKVCHMAQPSLSYQIGRLEEELGEALFVRKPRSVELSDAGKLLLESATLIVEEQERALSRFKLRERLGSGEVRFGIIPTVAPYLLPPLLGSYRAAYPGVGIVAREARTSELVKEVVAGDIEFAIVSDVAPELLEGYSLHLTRLFHEELILAAPNAHPAVGQSSLRLGSLDAGELILLSEGNCLRDQTLHLCKGDSRSNALVCEQLPTQLSMVGAGLGLAVVPEMAVKHAAPAGVSFLRLAAPAPKRLIGLLKRRGGRLSLASQEFVKRIRGAFAEEL